MERLKVFNELPRFEMDLFLPELGEALKPFLLSQWAILQLSLCSSQSHVYALDG